MKKDTISLILKLTFALMILTMISCVPLIKHERNERHIARLVKKDPSLVKTDSIFKDTSYKVPEIIDNLEVNLTGDSLLDDYQVDLLTGRFRDKLDSNAIDTLNHGFKQILAHASDVDTTIDDGKEKIHIQKKGKNIKITTDVIPPPLKIKEVIQVNTITPIKPATWYEKVFMKVGKTVTTSVFSFLIILILYFIFKAIKGSAPVH